MNIQLTPGIEKLLGEWIRNKHVTGSAFERIDTMHVFLDKELVHYSVNSGTNTIFDTVNMLELLAFAYTSPLTPLQVARGTEEEPENSAGFKCENCDKWILEGEKYDHDDDGIYWHENSCVDGEKAQGVVGDIIAEELANDMEINGGKIEHGKCKMKNEKNDGGIVF